MTEATTRKVGRPTQNVVSRAIREFRPENRAPVGGFRDILTLNTRDDDYHYRWVSDTSEEGNRVFRFIQGGYEFAPAEGHGVGQQHIYKSKNNDVGSVVRVPSGKEGYLYLMRIRRDWYKEDQDRKQAEIDEVERQMQQVDKDEYYGKHDIAHDK